MEKLLLVHYDEIALKKGNRVFFERRLCDNIFRALDGAAKKSRRRYGRLIFELASDADEGKVKKAIELLPGISNFSFAKSCALNIDEISKLSLSLAEGKKFESFRIDAKRSNKDFPLTSNQINIRVGSDIGARFKKKVDLDNAELCIYIVIGEKSAFIFAEKFFGVGGLPIGTAGKVVCLLSGGLDSPVAAFMMMTRGCTVVFAHAHNKAVGGEGIETKLSSIVDSLNAIQLSSKLYMIPFEEIQREIIENIPSKLRMIVYRRAMIRIANAVARSEHAKAIITGDSVGQVASQTLDNLACAYSASDLPILSPLIGTNKEDAICLARKIGTYEGSIIQSNDCCSFMIGEHPETHAKEEVVAELEKKIPLARLIKKAVNAARVKSFGKPIANSSKAPAPSPL